MVSDDFFSAQSSYDEIREKFEEYGAGGYAILETFVRDLLLLEAKKGGQALVFEDSQDYLPSDATAPDGIGDVEGRIAIEIVRAVTSRLVREAHKKANLLEGAGLLLVSLTSVSAEAIKQAGELRNVWIWGPEHLNQIVDQQRGNLDLLLSKALSTRWRPKESSGVDNWKARRTQTISEVRMRYRSGQFSLMLGAGVSSSAGLPDWNTLLNSLFVSMLTDDDTEKKTDDEQIGSIVRRLREVDGPSALILARYLRKGMAASVKSEKDRFIEAVTEKLYGLRDGRHSLSSALIKALVGLCAPGRTGARVRSVLTYNFDDLLERELSERGLAFKSIFEDIDLASAEQLPVYHVHGFLPQVRSVYQNIDKSTLVFSEEGYHRIYGDTYHWSNLIQLNSLRETTCLMVGLSLSDPNLRRLLEISAKSIETPKHYAFLKRIDPATFERENGKQMVRAPTGTIRKFLERHHRLNEQMMRELGVNVIWYESYDEVPRFLKDISSPD